ncbi:MAG: hypothetical protein ABFD79_17035 [Phycisphaerales bacterium]
MTKQASKLSITTWMVVILCVFTCMCNAVVPLPRIKARSASPYAQFYNTQTGTSFHPIGSSYVQLYRAGGRGSHSTFIPGLYDAKAAEKALTIMQQSGYTIVRIWCFEGHKWLRESNPAFYSVEGPYSTSGPELYQPYIDNLLDFLTRANRHNIYVQIVLDATPKNSFYDNLVNTGDSDVTGEVNREYMTAGAVKAKEIYLKEIVQSIINYDPNLLSTIFGYEVRNEIRSVSDEGPFNKDSGWVLTGNNKKYDMGSAISRQACQDDNIKNWANKCVAVVKEKDPDAMVCCSIFSFYCASQKYGLAGKGLLPLNLPGSWPVLPSTLLQTDFDYIDMHSYIPEDWDVTLESSQWSSLDKTLKPFMCGEFGALRTVYPDVFAAADALYNYRKIILDSGFQGALLFTWDTYVHTRWTAMEDGGVVNERLSPKNEWLNWQVDKNWYLQFWALRENY